MTENRPSIAPLPKGKSEWMPPINERPQFAEEMNNPEMRCANGIDYAVYSFNKDMEGTPLFVKLAWTVGADSRVGRPFLESLSRKHQRPIYTIDTVGTGKTSLPPNDFLKNMNFDKIAASEKTIMEGILEERRNDRQARVEEVGDERFDVAGISQGGIIAGKLAELYGDRVGKLLTVATPGFISRTRTELAAGLAITEGNNEKAIVSDDEYNIQLQRGFYEDIYGPKRIFGLITPEMIRKDNIKTQMKLAKLMTGAPMKGIADRLGSQTEWIDLIGEDDSVASTRDHEAEVNWKDHKYRYAKGEYPGAKLHILSKNSHAYSGVHPEIMADDMSKLLDAEGEEINLRPDAYTPTTAELAHERARIVGAREADKDEKLLTKVRKSLRSHETQEKDKAAKGFRDFNLSVEKPVRDGFYNPNPDFLATENNAKGVNEANHRFPDYHAQSEDLAPAPVLDRSETLMREIDEQQRRKDPESDQRLNSVFLNREAITAHPDNAVNVYFGPYLNVVGQEDEARARMLEVAREMPERALLSFDYPGMGGSDALTDEQKKRLPGEGYVSIADAQLRIMADMGITKISPFGISQGGYASLALAAEASNYGIEVESVSAIGTAGVEKMSLPKLGLREAQEGANLELHHSSPADPMMYEASGLENPGDSQKPPPPTDVWKKDPWLRYVRMMTKDSVQAMSRRVLETQPNAKILFVNGSEDTVSPVSAVNNVITTLRSEFDVDGKTRINKLILPGERHLAGIHPKSLAPIIKSQVEGTFL